MKAVQCDQCGSCAPNPNVGRHWDAPGVALPDGWVSLWAGNRATTAQLAQIEGEFCGTKCAGKYLTSYVPRLVPKERS